jgi:hypothetical protein
MIRKEKLNDTVYLLLGLRKPTQKIQYIGIILTHLFAWAVFFYLPFLFYRVKFIDSRAVINELITKVFLILLFYINYFYLIPKFLGKRNFLQYFTSILVFVTILLVIKVSLEKFSARHFIEFTAAPSRGLWIQRNIQDTSLHLPVPPGPSGNGVIFRQEGGVLISPQTIPLYDSDLILGLPRVAFFYTL